jgi:hypothetical protein
MPEQWISFSEAAQLVRVHIRSSIGRAEAIVRTALSSGEVRSGYDGALLLADDGLMDMRPDRFSKDDLLDWLDRHLSATPSQPTGRNRAQDIRDRAKEAIDALWPQGPPSRADLSSKTLCDQVRYWVATECRKRGLHPMKPSDDTILRAAGRKKTEAAKAAP